MDKIWYRNPSKSEIIGRCGGDEKTNDHAEPTKANHPPQKNIYVKKIITEAVLEAMLYCLKSDPEK